MPIVYFIIRSGKIILYIYKVIDLKHVLMRLNKKQS